jgi:hypothetical protein
MTTKRERIDRVRSIIIAPTSSLILTGAAAEVSAYSWN